MNRHINNGYAIFDNYSQNYEIKMLSNRIMARLGVLALTHQPIMLLPMPDIFGDLVRERGLATGLPLAFDYQPVCEWQDMEHDDRLCGLPAYFQITWNEGKNLPCEALSCAGHSVQFAVELKSDKMKFELISLGTGERY